MLFIVAPDSFKGCLSAPEVATAMEQGILAVFPQAEVIKIPIADGGEGTVDALVMATGGKTVTTTVTGPLGSPVEAHWGILGDGHTAVIEMASASGLPLVPKNLRNPLSTTTRGTGELVKEVLDCGLSHLILGIGGSATNDGGAGFASALGVDFLDSAGAKLPDGGGYLARLARINLSQLDPRVNKLTITVACDVTNPLCGANGASAVFGPQKGATQEMVPVLDAALSHYATLAAKATGRDMQNQPGAGAAGVLGAGLLYFTQATLQPGIELVLHATRFAEHLIKAHCVFTGEGHTDTQTALGKAPVGVAALAHKHNVPVICLSGGLCKGYAALCKRGITACASCIPCPMSLDESMHQGASLITEAAERTCRLLALGRLLPAS